MMGYVAPYIPDTLIETLKYIPSTSNAVKKVEPIEKKELNKYRLQNTMRKHQEINTHPYKGKHFDQYA